LPLKLLIEQDCYLQLANIIEFCRVKAYLVDYFINETGLSYIAPTYSLLI